MNERTESTEILRTRIYFGLPLAGYTSRHDRYEEQRAEFRTWALDVLLPFLEDASSDHLQVLYSENMIRDAEIKKVVVRDGTLASGSLLFIVIFSAFQMKSILPAVAGVFTIALSFPLAVALIPATDSLNRREK